MASTLETDSQTENNVHLYAISAVTRNDASRAAPPILCEPLWLGEILRVEMGPNAVYQIFAMGSQPIGGMMFLPNAAQGAGWMFYFHVEEIEAGNRAGAAEWRHLCLDTQRAMFGTVGPGRQRIWGH